MSLQRLAKECFGGLHIAVGAQSEVDGLPFAIDDPVQIGSLAANLHVGLVDAPRSPDLAGKAIPALLDSGTKRCTQRMIVV